MVVPSDEIVTIISEFKRILGILYLTSIAGLNAVSHIEIEVIIYAVFMLGQRHHLRFQISDLYSCDDVAKIWFAPF